MKRRTFLGVAAAGLLGATGYGLQRDGPLDVRVWTSQAAAAHDGVTDRVVGHLDRALTDAVGEVSVSAGGTVAVPTEDAYRLVTGTEWPRRLLAGLVGAGPAPVGGVNLLVTDGDMTRTPTGAGVPGLAAVGGAASLARMSPAAETPRVVGYSEPARVTQVLLHECGHALGLRHDHGAITGTDDERYPVVTPMVSSYAWARGPAGAARFGYEHSACGDTYPLLTPGEARLSLCYSACARRALGGETTVERLLGRWDGLVPGWMASD